jgi:hypothetical protein
MTLAAVYYTGEFKMDHMVFMGKRTGVAQLVPLTPTNFPSNTITKLSA